MNVFALRIHPYTTAREEPPGIGISNRGVSQVVLLSIGPKRM